MRHGLLVLLVLPCVLIADPVVVSGTGDNDYESWIARLRDGRLMVVFDRNPDFQSGDLYVTFSTDDGATWGSALPAVTGPGDQPLPCFVELPSDTIRLWYASNETGPYRIHSAWSLDGANWTGEGIVPLGWDNGAPWYYDPTVILEPDSSLTMLYSMQGTGAFIAHCPPGGTWDTLKTLVGASGLRPRIMKHSDGTYLAAYQHRSGPGQYDIDIFTRTSTDRLSWTEELRLTTNLNSHDAFVLEGPDGSYLAWYAKYEGGRYNIWYRRSCDAVNWEPEVQVTSDFERNTQPHLFIENGETYLVYAHAAAYPDNHDVYFWRLPYLGVGESGAGPVTTSLLSPNPCRDFVRLDVPGPELLVSIHDALGRLRRSLRVRPGEAVSTAGLGNGRHFLCVRGKSRASWYPFTVAR